MAMGDRVSLVLDGREREGGKDSKILDVAVDPSTLLMEGIVAMDQILDFLRDRR
jgi:tRNA A37 threonylcarbamoyladenosine synthetase subunit TsaC/SUA5/YrdC